MYLHLFSVDFIRYGDGWTLESGWTSQRLYGLGGSDDNGNTMVGRCLLDFWT